MMEEICAAGGKAVKTIVLTSRQSQLPALFAEVFKQLQAQRLVDHDLSRPLLEQEDNLPTGVATKPLGKHLPNFAFPHLASPAVKEPVLVLIRTAEPLFFANMLTPSRQVSVKIIWLLLDSSPARQARALSDLLDWLARTPGPQLRAVLAEPAAEAAAYFSQHL